MSGLTTVTIEARSVDIMRMLQGHRGEGNGKLQRDIEAAGSIVDYLKDHPIYKHLGVSHKGTAIACGLSEDMSEALDKPRRVAESQNLIVYSLDAEGNKVPWNDVEVATQSLS